MGSVAPERPVPARRAGFRSYEARQYAIEKYCVAEAEREVDAMLTGQAYQWRLFDERDWGEAHDLRLVQPMDFIRTVR